MPVSVPDEKAPLLKLDPEANIKTIFKNINLSVSPGEVLVVIGPVGSGKSSLLSALLGEIALLKGSIRSRGTFALVEQEPSIFAASVRENILFGKSENQERLAEVVQVCELEADLAQLPNGLDTLVGEAGLNISGGQRARLALARACYSDSDIYLLDDPLSAVDATVGKNIF